MKIRKHGVACIGAALWCATIVTTGPVTPYYSIRSQGLNTPRHISGVVQQVYAVNKDSLYGTLSAALEYNRSFHSQDITECLFGTKNCPAITISGSRVPNRGANDWLADYFYLPTDFKSTVNFNPIIDNVILDLNFFIGLDDWVKGLYFAAYAPLVHTRWNLNICEVVELQGTNSQIPGYFTPDTLQRNNLLNNFTEYANGTLTGPFEQTVGGTEYTITFQQLRNALMSSKEQNKTRFADLRLELGYNCIQKDHYGFGFAGYVSAPTGNRPEGTYLFEPISGNGHHWELGASIHGYGKMYCSENRDKQIIFYANAIITHLFASRQRRTLDLAGLPFSRYMLMERLGTPITDNLEGNGTTPSAQFKNEFQPVANLSCINVDVSVGVQTELTALMTCVCNHFSWDIGYNFWYRSCECIKLHGLNPFELSSSDICKWALKGDAQVFGFDRGADGMGALVGAVPLSATESKATIHSGTNFIPSRSFSEAIKNPSIDNPTNATGDASGGSSDHPLSAAPSSAALIIQTSRDPILIGTNAINVCERSTRGMSNKIFTHFNYTWNEREQWIPYIGIGGEVEFNHQPTNCNEQTCGSCIHCSMSQWGIWIKGGLSYQQMRAALTMLRFTC